MLFLLPPSGPSFPLSIVAEKKNGAESGEGPSGHKKKGGASMAAIASRSMPCTTRATRLTPASSMRSYTRCILQAARKAVPMQCPMPGRDGTLRAEWVEPVPNQGLPVVCQWLRSPGSSRGGKARISPDPAVRSHRM